MRSTGDYCNRCQYLIPQEEDQKQYEDHACMLFGGTQLKHHGEHPNIPRLQTCIDFDHVPLLLDDAWLEAFGQYFVELDLKEKTGIDFEDFVMKYRKVGPPTCLLKYCQSLQR